jgi:hypothetical protein
MHKVEKNYARNLESNDLLEKFLKRLLTYELIPLNEGLIEEQLSVFEPFQNQTENSRQHL